MTDRPEEPNGTALKESRLQTWLSGLERAGNRLPMPAMLFLWLALGLMVISAICAAFGLEASLPGQGSKVQARSLLSGEGVRWILTHTVDNFVTFAPVGTVLVAMLGLGVAEHSGLLRVLLERLVMFAPRMLLTWIVVFAGILSNLAMDAGYVVLIPLAALLFASAGRPPLAGIAAAFAGVSAGYSANLLLGPVDALLAGLSTEAVAVVDAGYEVNIAANYYFAAVSTLLLSGVGVWVTEKLVVPRLGVEAPDPVAEGRPGRSNRDRQEPSSQDRQGLFNQDRQGLSNKDREGLYTVGVWTLVFGALVVWASVPEAGLLRDPQEPELLDSALIHGIVVLIAFYAGVAGWLFGRFSGRFAGSRDLVAAMEATMSTMAGYLVLMFFAAQFVSFFAWTQLGTLMAVAGAQALGGLALPGSVLLLVFVLVAAVMNLFIGSASAKWGLLAPVFVPMLYLMGVSPEATQMAYRVGDSSTNIVTPLMPYFGVVVAFAQRYRKDLGVGTLVTMMLPYSLAFLFSWSLLLLAWFWLGLPLGPGAPMLLD